MVFSPNLDPSSKDMNILKDWSIQSLKAKYIYLRELKKIQQNYIEQLLTGSLKYIDTDQIGNVKGFANSYLANESARNDSVSNKIIEALRRYDNETEETSPDLNEKISILYEGQNNLNPDQTKKYYEEVISRIEKKYDEVCRIATQGYKSRENSITAENFLVSVF